MNTKNKVNTINKKKKAKKQITKKKNNIALFSILTVFLIVCSTLLFAFHPDFLRHSKNNTYEVSGVVTDFEYVSPTRIGNRLIRHAHYIHLDNGMTCKFYSLDYERHYNDPELEKIKNNLEGQYVILRLSDTDGRVITINTSDRCYLSFQASNRQYMAAIVGVTLFDSCVIFILYCVFLDSIKINKKSRKNNIFSIR